MTERSTEYWACRERAAVIDLSPLRKFEVTGPDAEALLQYCLTRDMRRLSVGQVVYTRNVLRAWRHDRRRHRCSGSAPNNFRWIGGDDFSGIWLRQQAEKMGYKAWVRSSTDQLHNIAVQGPSSRAILREIDLDAAVAAAARASSGGSVSRSVGSAISRARRWWCRAPAIRANSAMKSSAIRSDALAVFDAVWRAGEPHGMAAMGLEALDMVRIEAGLIFAN